MLNHYIFQLLDKNNRKITMIPVTLQGMDFGDMSDDSAVSESMEFDPTVFNKMRSRIHRKQGNYTGGTEVSFVSN